MCERVSRAITLPLESEQEAGERLFPVIQSYRKTHLKPRNQKTEEITALLLDLEKPEYASAIETLRIRTHIDELRRQNETYIALLHQRDEESPRRYMKERSADLRTTLTDLYKEMRDYAFASNLLHETDESRLFLSSLNTLIEDVRTNYKRRGPRKPKKENRKTRIKKDGLVQIAALLTSYFIFSGFLAHTFPGFCHSFIDIAADIVFAQ